jgi:hypothetical protein
MTRAIPEIRQFFSSAVPQGTDFTVQMTLA